MDAADDVITGSSQLGSDADSNGEPGDDDDEYETVRTQLTSVRDAVQLELCVCSQSTLARDRK